MKDPAFLFYPNDWIGGTMGMTFEEKGAYMELLMMQFNRGHMTEHMIAQTVGQLWVNIKDKFQIDGEGKFFNKRLEEEQKNRKTFTESRRNNLKGENQYTKNRGHMTTHMTSHMENENEDENTNVLKGGMGEISSIPFDDFWNLYDKKRGDKGKLSRRWDKMSAKDKEVIMAYIPAYKDATPDKQYRKDPQTFFNNRSWEDELITSKKEIITQEQKRDDHVHE